ncbi:MAG: stage II sporulation protein R [Clostridiales bacterium]|jgi:stage II sporulation protein R|nr:stage II sporulation protein R [Clostridiales bacterium]
MERKNYIGVIAAAAAVIIAVIGFNALFGTVKGGGADEREYLRIHIRANGNSAADQSVKYLVRDKIVEYLTPVLSETKNADDAAKKIKERLPEIESLTNGVLSANGYAYGAKADVREEAFPTRIYDGVTLESGVYNALIVELGRAEGDNWWCIAFPPLCFIPSEDDGSGVVKYRSKILEIIEKFYK